MKMPKMELARPADVFLIVVPNYWAKGKTLEEAKAGIRKISGIPAEKGQWIVYSVHKDAHCDSVFGNVMSPKGNKPIKLAEFIEK